MKIPELITGVLGIGGALAVTIGGGIGLGGLGASVIIRLGEFLSHDRNTYQRMMIYGTVGTGAGLLLIGASASITRVGNRKTKEELSQQFLQSWEEFEQLKKSCRGCAHYKGGGHCALHGNSRFHCSDREVKSECANCKYYSGNHYLPCAVHPDLKNNCVDWELK